MRFGRRSQLRIRIQDSLQQKLLFCWVRKLWPEAASVEARSAADDRWRLQINFFCSAVKWSEDECHRWSEIASPCCHLIRSEFCCLSGEFAEKASLQKFCNLNFECFLWKFNRNSAESRNLWFAESAKQFWFSRMLLDQRNLLGPRKFLRTPIMASFFVNGRLTGYGCAFLVDDLDDHKLNFSQNCQITSSDISVFEEMSFER